MLLGCQTHPQNPGLAPQTSLGLEGCQYGRRKLKNTSKELKSLKRSCQRKKQPACSCGVSGIRYADLPTSFLSPGCKFFASLLPLAPAMTLHFCSMC